MTRKYDVTITFVAEVAEGDTNEDIEAYYYDLVKDWDDCSQFNVEAHLEPGSRVR